MEKTSAEIGNDLDEIEKELDKTEDALLLWEEKRIDCSRIIAELQLKKKEFEDPITKGRFGIRKLTRAYTQLKRKFYQAKNSGL